MHNPSSRTVRGAAWLIVALSALTVAHARTPAKPTVVQVRHVKTISAESLKPVKRAQPMPAVARSSTPPAERGAAIELDGSRFQYDSCGCGN